MEINALALKGLKRLISDQIKQPYRGGKTLDSFEFNKIAAAVIAGLLLYVTVDIVAESLFHVEELEKSAYVVEGLEATEATTVEVVVDEGPSLSELMVTASADRGARVFRRCQACHTDASGAAHKVGPNLWGIMGAGRGAIADFGYSAALQSVGGDWSFENMDAYLASPAKAIPGNKMSFAGLRKENERADVMAYMNSKSDTPIPLP